MGDNWMTVEAEAALLVDHGRDVILCDRLPRPLTMLLKNPTRRDGACLPSAVDAEVPTSLADRGGASAAQPSEVPHA